MSLRLIDVDVEIPIEVSGTKIIVKPMTQGNKLRLSILTQKFHDAISSGRLDESDEELINGILAGQILRIDDPKYAGWEAGKILAGMDYGDKAALITELFRVSSLNEEERKN